MKLISTILHQIKATASEELVTKVEMKSHQLRNYILGLLGNSLKSQETADQAWDQIRKEKKFALEKKSLYLHG